MIILFFLSLLLSIHSICPMNSAIIEACKNDTLEQLLALEAITEDIIDYNFRDNTDRCPLDYALENYNFVHRNSDIVCHLITKGANLHFTPQSPGMRKLTPFLFICSQGLDILLTFIIDLNPELLRSKSDFDGYNPFFETTEHRDLNALMLAAENNHYLVVNALLKAIPHKMFFKIINATNIYNETAILHASIDVTQKRKNQSNNAIAKRSACILALNLADLKRVIESTQVDDLLKQDLALIQFHLRTNKRGSWKNIYIIFHCKD